MTIQDRGDELSFCCVSPDMRVLASDLQWISVSELQPGVIIYGCEKETPGKGIGKRPRRKIKPSTVMRRTVLMTDMYQIVLSNGVQIKASGDSFWLLSTKQSQNQVWMRTDTIAEDLNLGRNRYMRCFIPPWIEQRNTYHEGWLAGIMDGEGHISNGAGGMDIVVSQNEGVILSEIMRLFALYNIPYRSSRNKYSNVIALALLGEWTHKISVLGRFRPIRLIQNIERKLIEGNMNTTFGGADMLKVIECNKMGIQEAISIKTDTGTAFIEGFVFSYPLCDSVT